MEKVKSVSRGRNSSIVIVRVMAMLMIVGCHLASWYQINILAMVLNVGVYVFLIISGMLYSDKKIQNGFSFIRDRWVKLCIPMYIWVLFLVIYYLFRTETSVLKTLPVYLLNLQGACFVWPGINLPSMNGLGHLWFLTAIMICYILLVFAKNSSFEEIMQRYPYRFFLVLVIADVIISYVIGLQLHYFIAFFAGCVIERRKTALTLRNYIFATAIMVLAMVTRLLTRYYFDGTNFYNNVAVPFSHIILAVWIYLSVEYVHKIAPEWLTSIAQNRIIVCLEKLSMYIYITHYVFLVGPFYVDLLPISKAAQALVFIGLTFISAAVLKVISEQVIHLLLKKATNH